MKCACAIDIQRIDAIRARVDIVKLASKYTDIKRSKSLPEKYVGPCPFHFEKDRSFTVDYKKQLFHCFDCGTGGDIFTLIMEKENLNFEKAMEFLERLTL